MTRIARASVLLLSACLPMAGCSTMATSTLAPRPGPTSMASNLAAPTPTPSPIASELTVSGALEGRVRDVVATCDQQENVGGQANVYRYLAASGTLGQNVVTVWIFDPTGGREYESARHVIVWQYPSAPHSSPLSRWDEAAPAGVSGFDVHVGASIHASLAPLAMDDIQLRGTVTAQSDQPLTIDGRIVCGS